MAGMRGRRSPPAAWSAQAVVWRLATGYPAENFHTANLLAMAKDVEAATGGSFASRFIRATRCSR